MAYFVGKNLEKKIKEYGLEDLNQKLAAVSAGQQDWPIDQQLQIPVELDLLESCRIVIYSLLHTHDLKDNFQVRINLAARLVIVEHKASFLKKRDGQLSFVTKTAGQQPGDQPGQPERLGETLFTEEEFK